MDEEYLEYLSRTQKITLMLLYLEESPIKGKTWFQKELFLISKGDEKLADELEFEPNNYGPHSYEAVDALEGLEEDNLIEVIDNNEIRITESGRRASKYLVGSFNINELNFLKDIKEFLNDLNRMELLAFIYQTNPDMTTKSVELNNVKNRLLEYSISLYKKRKLSLAKSAQISGISLENFIKEISKRGIYIETGI